MHQLTQLLTLIIQKYLDFIFDLNSPITEYVDLLKLRDDLNINFIPNHLSKLIFSIISTNFF
jgi:hypothetical protein